MYDAPNVICSQILKTEAAAVCSSSGDEHSRSGIVSSLGKAGNHVLLLGKSELESQMFLSQDAGRAVLVPLAEALPGHARSLHSCPRPQGTCGVRVDVLSVCVVKC